MQFAPREFDERRREHPQYKMISVSFHAAQKYAIGS
jgi:hypothetical protein